jgi:hypothetical protein
VSRRRASDTSDANQPALDAPRISDKLDSDSPPDPPKTRISFATLEESVESIQSIEECNTLHTQLEILKSRLDRKRVSALLLLLFSPFSYGDERSC